MVSIILVSYNEGLLTKDCVESIKKNVSLEYEIIVVDNGSKTETLDILRSLPGIRLVETNKNSGFPAGCNTGLAQARGDIIWFLNNDTIVPKGSLERMVELLLSDSSIGMVGPVTNRISGRQEIPVDYDDYSGIEAFARKTAEENKGKTWRMIRLCGFSMLLRKSVIDQIGGLDERMGIGTFEDDELCLLLVKKGLRLLAARDAFIHHIGNASFKAAGGYPPIGDKNQRIASAVMGMTIPDETILNETLLPLLDTNAKRVLHVQCGAGAYGLTAAENGVYAEGLESNPVKAEIARQHYNRFTGYTEGEPFTFDGRGFEALMIEQQVSSDTAFSLVQSLTPALAGGAQLLLQVPKITAIQGQVYSAYFDGWNASGNYAIRGRFDSGVFLNKMAALGYVLRHFDLAEARRGFFNRNSFARHLETARGEEKGLDFFQYANFVFYLHHGAVKQ